MLNHGHQRALWPYKGEIPKWSTYLHNVLTTPMTLNESDTLYTQIRLAYIGLYYHLYVLKQFTMKINV